MKGVKKCFGLLLVLFIIFGLSLSVFSENTSAASSFSWTSPGTNFMILDPSVGAFMPATSVGSYFAVNTGFTTNRIRWVGTPVFYPSTGDYITIAGNFATLFDYNASGINEPPEFTCPSFNIDSMLTQVDCTMSVSHDVSGGQHLTVYNWVYTGQFSSPYQSGGVNNLTAELFFKNNLSTIIRIYVSGLSINVGQSLEQVNINAIRSFNNDFTSLMSTLFNNISSQTSTLESAIQYFNRDYISYTQDLLELLGDLDVEAISQAQQKVDDQIEQEQQDRENMDSQQTDVSNAGDSSQADAESTGTTLLAAFTSFVGALTSASPSNCNIDMDLGNLDLGIVNLCQLSLPSGFSALATIFMILFCVPLSVATGRRVISLFRSFQT